MSNETTITSFRTRDLSSYSALQIRILKWMYFPGSLLSVISSWLLLRHLLFGSESLLRSNRRRTYHRILLGLSIADLVASFALLVIAPVLYSPNLQPGTACTIDGLFQFVATVAPVYLAFLSIYFLLVIRYSVTEEVIAKRYEFWFHFFAIFFPSSSATWALLDKAINPLDSNLGCFINEYPINCHMDSSCQRGKTAPILMIYATIAGFGIVLIVIVVSNSLIYFTVRQFETRSRRHDFVSGHIQQQQQQQQSSRRTGRIWGNERRSSSSRSGNTSRANQVAVQSFLFVLAFFLTYIFGIVLFVIHWVDPLGVQRAKYFVFQVLAGSTWPLQGFFDLLVFIRPRYLQWRRRRRDQEQQAEHNNMDCHRRQGEKASHFIKAAFSLEEAPQQRPVVGMEEDEEEDYDDAIYPENHNVVPPLLFPSHENPTNIDSHHRLLIPTNDNEQPSRLCFGDDENYKSCFEDET